MQLDDAAKCALAKSILIFIEKNIAPPESATTSYQALVNKAVNSAFDLINAVATLYHSVVHKTLEEGDALFEVLKSGNEVGNTSFSLD